MPRRLWESKKVCMSGKMKTQIIDISFMTTAEWKHILCGTLS